MKYFLILLTTICPIAFAQPAPVSIAQQLRSFSPLVRIYLNHLNLADKNSNGVIDKGAGEGYEAFTAKYGNADVGFHANGVILGAANGKLEEPEIVNHYYINIRFKPDFQKENAAIESEIKTYVYANNLPLVWLDDEQGTVMKAVNKVLGEGWQNKQVSESEAVKMFQQVVSSMNIKGLTGTPSKNDGYYTLPNFVILKTGYCFEIAQFGFWFFSQLKISSFDVDTALTPALIHAVIKLYNSGTIIDYFQTSKPYNVPINQWANLNPIQSIAEYFKAQARSKNSQPLAEKSVIYNKYNIPYTAYLMDMYAQNSRPNHTEIIAMGEFILQNVDVSRVMHSNVKEIGVIKDALARILSILIESYSATRNRMGFNNIERLLNQYYRDDPSVKPFLDYYRF